MRPVPGAGGRVIGEGHPVVDRARGGRTGKVPAQAHCLATVTQDALVDRPPPRATGAVTKGWLQHTSPQLPAHERHRRPPKRQMPGCHTERAVITALHQGDPAGWVVAHRGDLLLSPGCGRNPGSHAKMIAPVVCGPLLRRGFAEDRLVYRKDVA